VDCNLPFQDGVSLEDAIGILGEAIEVSQQPTDQRIEQTLGEVHLYRRQDSPLLAWRQAGSAIWDSACPSEIRLWSRALSTMLRVQTALNARVPEIEHQHLRELRNGLSRHYEKREKFRASAEASVGPSKTKFRAKLARVEGVTIPNCLERIEQEEQKITPERRAKRQDMLARQEDLRDTLTFAPDVVKWYDLVKFHGLL